MMYAKLALRNVKRSAKDYLIYVIQVLTTYSASSLEELPKTTLDYDYITKYLNENGYPLSKAATGQLYLLQADDIDKTVKNAPLLAMIFKFGLPVMVSLIFSIGTLAFLTLTGYEEYIVYISLNEMLAIFAVVYAAFIGILISYFVSTYYLFKKHMALS